MRLYDVTLDWDELRELVDAARFAVSRAPWNDEKKRALLERATLVLVDAAWKQ